MYVARGVRETRTSLLLFVGRLHRCCLRSSLHAFEARWEGFTRGTWRESSQDGLERVGREREGGRRTEGGTTGEGARDDSSIQRIVVEVSKDRLGELKRTRRVRIYPDSTPGLS